MPTRDSSFDPLALVKAMGPQHDPYQWAQMYGQDAAKGQQLLAEMKNRMMIHESDQAARAKEGSANRASHENIARESQFGQNERARKRLEHWQAAKTLAEKNFDFPPGAFPADQATARAMGITTGVPQDIDKTHRLVVRGSHRLYVPNDYVAPIPGVKYPAPVVNPYEGD